MSPLPVIRIVLFGSRARGDAASGSDWDVAVVVRNGGGSQAVREVRNFFADLALPTIASGFHLRPIVICSTEDSPDPDVWQVSPSLAHDIKTDGLLIA